MKKKGRPKIDNPRCYSYRIRLTAGEKEALKEASRFSNQSMADIIRQAIHEQCTKLVFGESIHPDILRPIDVFGVYDAEFKKLMTKAPKELIQED